MHASNLKLVIYTNMVKYIIQKNRETETGSFTAAMPAVSPSQKIQISTLAHIISACFASETATNYNYVSFKLLSRFGTSEPATQKNPNKSKGNPNLWRSRWGSYGRAVFPMRAMLVEQRVTSVFSLPKGHS